ncbi:MAG: T9SS type A sorting domain-containing protein [Flavobacteriales bacterium]|nr:T9SS type A sorting domain-containing protein [Flavobacteriales bacterium]
MRKHISFLGLVLTASLAQAQVITNVVITPQNPTACTLINLNVFGTIPTSGMLLGFSPSVNGTVITVSFSGSGGTGGSTPFNQLLAGLGPFAPGPYTVIVPFTYNGTVTSTWTGSFTVAPGFNPDAGEYGDTLICNGGVPFPLISVLNGNPDVGGDWFYPNNTPVPNGMFMPGIATEGFYLYSFDVEAPCIDASQQILIQFIPNNSPGTSGTVQVCASGGAPVNLFTVLGGTPFVGGTWAFNGAPHSNIFTPGVDACGNYIYTVPGIAPCGPASATVIVQCVQPPNAGNNGSLTVLSCDTVENLNSTLQGEPNTGIWVSPDGFIIGGFNANVNIALNGPGAYGYVVTGQGGICPSDTAFIVVDTLACVVGMEELDQNVARFLLSPNPASDQVTIEVELVQPGDAHVLELLDVNGQLVRSEKLTFAGTLARRVLAVGDLAKGVYMVRLSSPQGHVVRRLMLR